MKYHMLDFTSITTKIFQDWENKTLNGVDNWGGNNINEMIDLNPSLLIAQIVQQYKDTRLHPWISNISPPFPKNSYKFEW